MLRIMLGEKSLPKAKELKFMDINQRLYFECKRFNIITLTTLLFRLLRRHMMLDVNELLELAIKETDNLIDSDNKIYKF